MTQNLDLLAPQDPRGMGVRKQSSLQLSLASMSEVDDLERVYDVEKSIGTGKFSSILLAKRKDCQQTIVLKTFSRKVVKQVDFLKEYNMSFFLSPHPNIVDTFEGIFCTPDSFFFVQEYCPLGSLRDAVDSYGAGAPEDTVKRMVKQLVAALEFMHTEKLVHRNLKPKNILIFDAQMHKVKLSDLALVRREGTMIMHTDQTNSVHPPELCDCLVRESYSVNSSMDIWSLGILMYYSLRGRYPWEKATIMCKPYWEWEEWVKGKKPHRPSRWVRFTDKGAKMFRKLLHPKAKERCTAKEVLKFFKFKWVKELKSISEDDLHLAIPPSSHSHSSSVTALATARRRATTTRIGDRVQSTDNNSSRTPENATAFQKRRSIIQSWLATTISAMAEISEQVVSATE